MLTLDKNPFVWNESGNISGVVGALSLAAQDGSLITVENLSEDVEVSSVDPYLQNWILFCNYYLKKKSLVISISPCFLHAQCEDSC